MDFKNAAVQFYEQSFGAAILFLKEDIFAWTNDLNEELVIEAMKIALEKDIHNFAYVKSILRDWHANNITTPEEVKRK